MFCYLCEKMPLGEGDVIKDDEISVPLLITPKQATTWQSSMNKNVNKVQDLGELL